HSPDVPITQHSPPTRRSSDLPSPAAPTLALVTPFQDGPSPPPFFSPRRAQRTRKARRHRASSSVRPTASGEAASRPPARTFDRMVRLTYRRPGLARHSGLSPAALPPVRHARAPRLPRRPHAVRAGALRLAPPRAPGRAVVRRPPAAPAAERPRTDGADVPPPLPRPRARPPHAHASPEAAGSDVRRLSLTRPSAWPPSAASPPCRPRRRP